MVDQLSSGKESSLATLLVQGGEMPGTLTAQTWTSALKTCSDCIQGAEEAQRWTYISSVIHSMLLLYHWTLMTACFINEPWHNSTTTILVKKMRLHHSSLEGSLLFCLYFPSGQSSWAFLTLAKGNSLFHPCCSALCNRVTKHDCCKPTLGGPFQSSPNLPHPRWLL